MDIFKKGLVVVVIVSLIGAFVPVMFSYLAVGDGDANLWARRMVPGEIWPGLFYANPVDVTFFTFYLVFSLFAIGIIGIQRSYIYKMAVASALYASVALQYLIFFVLADQKICWVGISTDHLPQTFWARFGEFQYWCIGVFAIWHIGMALGQLMDVVAPLRQDDDICTSSSSN